MNREDFKARWESNQNGGGITNNEIADCAINWGISQHPYTQPIRSIVYRVLKSAGTNDAEDYKPNSW